MFLLCHLLYNFVLSFSICKRELLTISSFYLLESLQEVCATGRRGIVIPPLQVRKQRLGKFTGFARRIRTHSQGSRLLLPCSSPFVNFNDRKQP